MMMMMLAIPVFALLLFVVPCAHGDLGEIRSLQYHQREAMERERRSYWERRCSNKYNLLLARWAANDFDYSVLYGEDSVYQLSQAGSYEGVDAIVEYVAFTTSAAPYLAETGRVDRQVNFMDYDPRTGICVFTNPGVNNVTTDPETTVSAVEFSYLYNLKEYYNLRKDYTVRTNVFLADAFLEYYFGTVLNSNNTREYVCGVMTGSCSNILGPVEDCDENLASLPITTDGVYADGKSQACRVLHADFADENPDLHCPHLSFEPLADPNGNVKCQVTQGVQPTDLFTEEDFELMNAYAESIGMDPLIGYEVLN